VERFRIWNAKKRDLTKITEFTTVILSTDIRGPEPTQNLKFPYMIRHNYSTNWFPSISTIYCRKGNLKKPQQQGMHANSPAESLEKKETRVCHVFRKKIKGGK